MSELAAPGLWLPPKRALVKPTLLRPLKRWLLPGTKTFDDAMAAAVTVDQGSLGTQATSGSTTSAKATTAIVASGAMIVAITFTFTTATPTASHTMSGGSLTWVRDHTSTSGTLRISVHHAFAPSGLAASTSLTNTSANTSDHTWVMYSLLGVDTTTPVAAFNAVAASTAAWSSGTLTGSPAGGAVVGGRGSDGTLLTTVIAGDNVERIDFNSATTSGSVCLYDDLDSEADDTVTGTSSAAQAHIGIGVAYNAAGGAAAASEGGIDVHRRAMRSLIVR